MARRLAVLSENISQNAPFGLLNDLQGKLDEITLEAVLF